MNLVKLFLLSILLGGGGAALGAVAGTNIGAGGLLLGGLVAGVVFVVLSGVLSVYWHWINPSQRLWCILGGAFGFALAWMVTLATLATPAAVVAATFLVGAGAVLGAVVGREPHTKS